QNQQLRALAQSACDALDDVLRIFQRRRNIYFPIHRPPPPSRIPHRLPHGVVHVIRRHNLIAARQRDRRQHRRHPLGRIGHQREILVLHPEPPTDRRLAAFHQLVIPPAQKLHRLGLDPPPPPFLMPERRPRD